MEPEKVSNPSIKVLNSDPIIVLNQDPLQILNLDPLEILNHQSIEEVLKSTAMEMEVLSSDPPKFQLSTSNIKSFTKVIPIIDPYIAKLLSQNPEKFLKTFFELAETLSIKFRFKIDQYSTSLELSMEGPENDNIEILNQKFSKIIEEIMNNIKEIKIPCSLEEHNSLRKYMEKGRISKEIDIHYLNEIENKPLILKEFIVNQGFTIQIVLIEDFQTLTLEANDNLVINMTQSGVFLDDFMQKQKICNEITKFFKKNQTSYKKDEIFEANLPEFKVFLQIFNFKELLEAGFLRIMTKLYIRQVLERILLNKQFINLYFPVSPGQEKEIIKTFLEEMLEVSKLCNEEQNFLMFPSKICFICVDKQKEILIETFNKIKEIGNLCEMPQEFKHGGRWNIVNDIINVHRHSSHKRNVIPHNSYNTITLNSQTSRIIERAYILGEKQGMVLIDERNQGSGVVPLNNNNNIPNQMNLQNENFVNEDVITINLKNMVETSKVTGYEKPLIFDEVTGIGEYLYLDAVSGEFLSYDTKISQALNCLKKLHGEKLVFHLDFETMQPIEQLYSFDLVNFTIRYEENLNNLDNSIRNNLDKFFNPPVQNQNTKVFNIMRTIDEKYDGLLNNTLKYVQKNKESEINLIEIEMIDKSIDKVPQLIIRSFENIETTLQTIENLLLKKKVIHMMRMKQNSKLLRKSLEDLCLRNNINWELKDNILKIKGNRKTINNIRLEIQKLDDMDLEDAIFPETWIPQNENLKEVELQSNCFEFLDVSKAFKKTCPELEIVKITRIQNKKLWENYIFEKKRLHFKGNSTEKMLFHGTKGNDPRKLYTGIEEGFDLRLAHHGVVGKGIYFAELASYSTNGYAYSKSNGNFILIYANVLVGAFIDGMASSNYLMPPLMPNDSNLRYDSVRTARTNFTVYNGNRAYPSYVIEYKGIQVNLAMNGNIVNNNNNNKGANFANFIDVKSDEEDA